MTRLGKKKQTGGTRAKNSASQVDAKPHNTVNGLPMSGTKTSGSSLHLLKKGKNEEKK